MYKILPAMTLTVLNNSISSLEMDPIGCVKLYSGEKCRGKHWIFQSDCFGARCPPHRVLADSCDFVNQPNSYEACETPKELDLGHLDAFPWEMKLKTRKFGDIETFLLNDSECHNLGNFDKNGSSLAKYGNRCLEIFSLPDCSPEADRSIWKSSCVGTNCCNRPGFITVWNIRNKKNSFRACNSETKTIFSKNYKKSPSNENVALPRNASLSPLITSDMKDFGSLELPNQWNFTMFKHYFWKGKSVTLIPQDYDCHNFTVLSFDVSSFIMEGDGCIEL